MSVMGSRGLDVVQTPHQTKRTVFGGGVKDKALKSKGKGASYTIQQR